MRSRMSIIAGVVAAAATILGAPPASAETTDVTFTLDGGLLSISVQPTAALGAKGNSGTTTVSGQLGAVTVTDNRGGTTGWSARAATTAFGNETTTASSVSYNSGLPTFTGAVTPVSAGPTTLTATATEVVAGTMVVGNNTATWNPTLTITLPSSSTAGTYAGTITTSVL